MQTFIDFLVNNYLWFLIISLVLVFALIGYLVDTSEKPNKVSKEEENEKPVEEVVEVEAKKEEEQKPEEKAKEETEKREEQEIEVLDDL